ncbi:group 10 secretory phospholipase A2 [Sceloporus undulatus]|uniref:group 10 secretory phospholipase A2 n=1 Tax=Sceloporus undulatus TaxID=8520 RepID=UPI001C4DCE60|nr:group 10 secretory phospholipase A2 [Sceloporus undulatus]
MGPLGRPPGPFLFLLLMLMLRLASASMAGEEGAGGAFGDAPRRSRRGVLQLAGAIFCATGRTPLAYLRYGCYCGLGGSGWPRDKVDWCCFRHDCCYAKAEKEGCGPKTGSYTWECQDNKAKCEDTDKTEDKCQKMACECDQEAAQCLAKAPYNSKYVFWPVTLCGTHNPECEDD